MKFCDRYCDAEIAARCGERYDCQLVTIDSVMQDGTPRTDVGYIRRKKRPGELSIIKLVTPGALARLLGKSQRWVYDHAEELGAVKVGKSWIFTKEGVANAFQAKGQPEMAGPGKVSGPQVSSGLPNEKRSRGLGSRKAQGTNAGSGADANADRHGLRRLL